MVPTRLIPTESYLATSTAGVISLSSQCHKEATASDGPRIDTVNLLSPSTLSDIPSNTTPVIARLSNEASLASGDILDVLDVQLNTSP
jgi:hypothetical protein